MGSTRVVLRPEMLDLRPAGGEGIPAFVKTLSFVGPLVRYRVVLANGDEIIVDVHNPAEATIFSEGSEVTVQLPAEVPCLLLEEASEPSVIQSA
jgi:ABC-type Fe3+/spermidine/putrescine transport system ATPase subunit